MFARETEIHRDLVWLAIRACCRKPMLILPIAAVLLFVLPGCSGAKGIADEQVVPRTPENVVLVYTDNTPGIRMMAYVVHSAVRMQGHATVVTTDEVDFIRRLPTRPWARVVVATRFESTRPAYLKPLRAYMESVERARAEIYTWLENPEAPARPGSAVTAPIAMQDWHGGFITTRTYLSCENPPKLDAIQGAYILCDFSGVQPAPLEYQEEVELHCKPLEPGEYEPLEKAQSASP